jgi:hypothetical protein
MNKDFLNFQRFANTDGKLMMQNTGFHSLNSSAQFGNNSQYKQSVLNLPNALEMTANQIQRDNLGGSKAFNMKNSIFPGNLSLFNGKMSLNHAFMKNFSSGSNEDNTEVLTMPMGL